MPGFVGGSALMRSRRPASRPLTAGGLRSVSLLVPRPAPRGFGSSRGDFALVTGWEWPAGRTAGGGSARARNCWLIPILARGVRSVTTGHLAPSVTCGG